MNNIDVGDDVQLNPPPRPPLPPNRLYNTCNVVWGRHNNNVNGLGKVLRINRDRVGVNTANVRTNNGAIITLPIACLREHYAAGGGRRNAKLNLKERNLKKENLKEEPNDVLRINNFTIALGIFFI
jgi:hypothetical protein